MLAAGTAAGRGKFDADSLRRVTFGIFGEHLLEMGCPYKGKVRLMSFIGVGVVLSKLTRG